MPETQHYDTISRLNHWIIAAAMIGMLGFGLYLGYGDLTRDAKRPLIGLHKSFGVLVLIFGVWRVAWRAVRGFPASCSDGPTWQKQAAMAAHVALLAGILIMPVSGILSSVFRGRAVDVFGWVSIPAQAELPWLASLSGSVHDYTGLGLSALVILHVAAAFKHHFFDRDSTLTRMIVRGPRGAAK